MFRKSGSSEGVISISGNQIEVLLLFLNENWMTFDAKFLSDDQNKNTYFNHLLERLCLIYIQARYGSNLEWIFDNINHSQKKNKRSFRKRLLSIEIDKIDINSQQELKEEIIIRPPPMCLLCLTEVTEDAYESQVCLSQGFSHVYHSSCMQEYAWHSMLNWNPVLLCLDGNCKEIGDEDIRILLGDEYEKYVDIWLKCCVDTHIDSFYQCSTINCPNVVFLTEEDL